MKRTVHVVIPILMLLILVVCIVPLRKTNAETSPKYNAEAEKLKQMCLFLGTNSGFELSREPKRDEALVILIRLIGKEKEALNCKYTHPFTDVDWADRYVAYAYHTGLTNGISKDKFGSKNSMTSAQFITFIL
ncbi:MAG: S-layer homology domain-containing protein [Eubacteriales bacterium]|nr:S-layer homology domain-containing protein [Eubacteriales bacterium]